MTRCPRGGEVVGGEKATR